MMLMKATIKHNFVSQSLTYLDRIPSFHFHSHILQKDADTSDPSITPKKPGNTQKIQLNGAIYSVWVTSILRFLISDL